MPPLFAQAAGGNLLYVGTYAGAPAGSGPVHKDSDIATLADLKGKKFAFKRGSSAHNFAVKALRKGGLAPGDVEAVDLFAPPDALAAFRSGAIDAWAIWDPYFAVAEADARVRPRPRASPPPGAHFLANGDFTAANPELVVELLDELKRVGTAAQADLAATVPALSAITGVPEDIQAVVLNRRGADLGRVGPLTPEVIATSRRWRTSSTARHPAEAPRHRSDRLAAACELTRPRGPRP